MNVSLPDEHKSFVDEQVTAKGYDSTDEYVRQLIRAEHDRQRLRDLVLEGLNSPLSTESNEEFFERLHKSIDDGD